MAVKLNLLPEELAVNKGVASMAKVFKNLSLVSLVVLIVFGLGLLGFFIFSSIELRNLESETASITSQIKDQEAAEQKIVLLKDRLAKIKTISSIDSSDQSLQIITPVLANLPGDSSLGELTIDPQKIDTAITFRSSASLSDFFNSLSTAEDFSSISLNNFSYNPSVGYLVGVRFVKK